jgi:uncharacterized protein
VIQRLAVVLVVWVALSGAGCGSSDETTESTTPPSAETDVLDRLPEVPEATEATRPPASPDGTGGDAFLTAVFDDAQTMWQQEFEDAGSAYTPAKLTIFRDQVDTACGAQSANIGPFYCPADHGVYLDTRFFDALGRAAGVRLGDFAQAYVVAHELGHHVQALVGTAQRVHALDEQDPAGKNARSVRLELQADCFAGIWMHTRYRQGQLSQADLEDALRAAAVVGSDFQQHKATGTITPEDWTHGSSQQRQQWLTTGFQQGRPAACDTFAGV